jgi:hypothetical protein
MPTAVSFPPDRYQSVLERGYSRILGLHTDFFFREKRTVIQNVSKVEAYQRELVSNSDTMLPLTQDIGCVS